MDSSKKRTARKMTIKLSPLPARRLRSLVSSLVLFWCLVEPAILPVCGWSQNIPKTGQNPTTADGVAASDFALQLLDGKSISLETLRGKPLMINFFASWCDPCREEMPLINELAARAGKEGYNVLGIAIEDRHAAVMQYAKEARLVFPIALDPNSSVKRAYRVFGPPATFFIDGRGMIREVVMGIITPERARAGLKKAGVK